MQRTLPKYSALLALLTLTVMTGCIDLSQTGRCTSDAQCRYGRVCGPSGFCVATPDGEPPPDAGPAPDGEPPPQPQPRLVARPERLHFERIDGADPTWRTSKRDGTIRNAGNAVAHIDDVVLSGHASFALEIPGAADDDPTPWPDELAPGESFDVRVWYHTESNEPVTAELIVRTREPTHTLRLPISADPNPPCIKVDPERNLRFSPVRPHQRIVKEVQVTNCGDESTLAIRNVRLEIDSGGGFYVPEDQLPEPLPARSALLAPGESTSITVVHTGETVQWNEGELVIETNVPNRRRIRIGLLRDTDVNDCPVARGGARLYQDGDEVPFVRSLRVSMGDLVQLSARDSVDPDGRVARYEWTEVQFPGGTDEVPPAAQDLVFEAATPGTYLFELQVWDDQGLVNCGGPSRVTVVAE